MTKYQKHISSPLLDGIDIHIQAPRVDYDKLSDKRMGESPKTVRARVEAARDRQRFAGLKDISCNANMHPTEVRKFCDLDADCSILIKTAMSWLQF